MATCKTCHWWGRDYDRCCSLVDAYPPGSHSFEIIATVADDHNLTTRLATGPEFGCVHHAPKKEPQAG